MEDNLNSKLNECHEKLDEKVKQYKDLQEKFDILEKEFKELVMFF